MQPSPLIAYTVLIVFTVNAILVAALIVIKLVHRRRTAAHKARRHLYLELLSRHLALGDDGAPLTAEVAEDPAFLDALIDLRNVVSGEEVSTLRTIANRHGVIERQIRHLDSKVPLGRRLRAAVALAEIGDETAAPALMRHLGDREPEIRIQAARGLGRIQWTPAIDHIVWRFGVESPWVRTRFSDTLTGFGAKATWPLLAYVKINHRFDGKGPALALRTIARIQDDQAVGPLLEILAAADDLEIQIATVEALGELGSPEALPALLQLIESPHWQLRAKAATALGGIGDRSAIPHLRAAMRDSNWWVRRDSAAAMARLPEGVAMLYQALDDIDPFAADAAAEALTDVGELVSARRRVEQGETQREPLLAHMGHGEMTAS